MADTNASFHGSIPALYDRHLGPVMFEPYAVDLAHRIPASPDAPVLELACGTGILTRQLRHRLVAGVGLVATDLNESMLEVARSKDIAGVEFRQADAAELPFDAATFAAVACQFGIMFVPPERKAAAFSEIHRVLRPGGLFAFNVWATLEHNAFARIAREVVNSFFPENPPTFYQIPFSFSDPAVIRSFLANAGFKDVEIENVGLPLFASSAESFATGLVRGNPVVLAIEERGASPHAIAQATAEALGRDGGNEPYRSTMLAVAVTARA